MGSIGENNFHQSDSDRIWFATLPVRYPAHLLERKEGTNADPRTFFSDQSKLLRASFLDFFEAVSQRSRGVIIASSQRCGTHLTGAYLGACEIGVPGEHFLEYLNARRSDSAEPDRLASSVRHVLNAGSGELQSAFSLVLMDYAEQIESDLEAIGLSSSLLARSMKHLTWVWLRRDWVDVAVSHYFAVKTGAWESEHGEHAPPPYAADEIYRWWRHVQATDAYWERYFQRYSLNPIELHYEQLIRDPAILTGIVARAGGNPEGLNKARLPARMPHAQCKQLYAARFRQFLAEKRSAELYQRHQERKAHAPT